MSKPVPRNEEWFTRGPLRTGTPNPVPRFPRTVSAGIRFSDKYQVNGLMVYRDLHLKPLVHETPRSTIHFPFTV